MKLRAKHHCVDVLLKHLSVLISDGIFASYLGSDLSDNLIPTKLCREELVATQLENPGSAHLDHELNDSRVVQYSSFASTHQSLHDLVYMGEVKTLAAKSQQVECLPSIISKQHLPKSISFSLVRLACYFLDFQVHLSQLFISLSLVKVE